MGKFTYNKLLLLKRLAKDSVGIKSGTYFSLIKRYISLINSLNNELKIIENDIYEIMNMVDTKLTTIPGLSLMSAAICLLYTSRCV